MRIPKPLIFQWKHMQMSSQQPSGNSKTLIIDSQQRHAASKTIDISMKKTCKCVHGEVLGRPVRNYNSISDYFTMILLRFC